MFVACGAGMLNGSRSFCVKNTKVEAQCAKLLLFLLSSLSLSRGHYATKASIEPALLEPQQDQISWSGG